MRGHNINSVSCGKDSTALTYGSVCSGIEAASVAWHRLGFRASWFAEIEPFPSAVLAHRWPTVPNLGDMTKLAREVLLGSIAAPLILVGGTPCQDFSVAGMRAGLAGEGGALTMKFVEIADAIDHVRPDGDECVVVWENVPGVLSDKGNAFGNFLAALVGEPEELQPPGGKWKDAGCMYGPKRTAAWRILDAQYFGLAQRRRRVFVIASARTGFDPCEVLFEREGLRRDHPPRRGEGENIACTLDARTEGGGFPGTDGATGGHVVAPPAWPKAFSGNNTSGPIEVATARNACASGRMDFESETFVVHGTQDPIVSTEVAHALGRNHGQENAVVAFVDNSRAEVRLEGGDGQIVGAFSAGGGKPGQGQPCITFSGKDYGTDAGDVAPTLRAMGHGESPANAGGQVAIAYLLLEVGKRTGRSTSDPRAGLGVGGENDPMFTLQASAQHGVCVTGDITHTLKAEGFDASEDGTGRGQPIISVSLRGRDGGGTIEAGDEIASCLRASSGGGDKPHALVHSAVRRLTPRECERLQGFPDYYTMIPWRGKPAEECPDGPRHKAIGNSKAVPVVRWIGKRLLQQLERTA